MSWAKRAACRELPKEMFYPEGGQNRMGLERLREAQAVCRVCPVKAHCRTEAVRRRETEGVWGEREFGSGHQPKTCRTCGHRFWAPPPVLFCSVDCEKSQEPIEEPPEELIQASRQRLPGLRVIEFMRKNYGVLPGYKMAEVAGVAPETIRRWEGGGHVRDLKLAATVARWLGVKPWDIWEEWPAA